MRNLSQIDIQFSEKYEPEKMRRFVQEVKNITIAVNGLIQTGNTTTSTSTPAIEHVVATIGGLGASHTVAGLTAGQVLKAIAPNNAAFKVLEFAEMGRVDPASFNNASQGDVFMMWDGFFSMRPSTDILGVSDPGADALLSWDQSIPGFTWRLPGTGLTITGGFLNVDLPAIIAVVIAANPPAIYPRFLLMGA